MPLLSVYVLYHHFVLLGLEHGGDNWTTTDILVKISSHFSDSKLADKVGYIKNISGHVCNVFLQDENRVASVTGDQLEPIIPDKGDKVGPLRWCIF